MANRKQTKRDRKFYKADKKAVKRETRAAYAFDAQKAKLAPLLDGYDDDFASWQEAETGPLRQAYSSSWFFSKDLTRLSGRVQPIETAINEAALLPSDSMALLGEIFRRKNMTEAVAGKPITLNQVAKIYHALTLLADHPAGAEHLDIGDGREKVVFRMGRNSIVPALLHAKSKPIRSFRECFGLSKADLGYVVFGDVSYAEDIFERLEEGLVDRGTYYEYRLTKYTASLIHECFAVIYEQAERVDSAWIEQEYIEKRIDKIERAPTFKWLFDVTHTSGPSGGKCTKSLPIVDGNLLGYPQKFIDKSMRVNGFKTRLQEKLAQGLRQVS